MDKNLEPLVLITSLKGNTSTVLNREPRFLSKEETMLLYICIF